jgi:predicted ATPase/class 3 adenylate cyclase
MSLLCCDVVDSSALARDLDPEDVRYAINNFHQISKQLIEQYEGYYAHHMGDGFMAYFSYPNAHEDDAYRAVLTGLRIIEAIRGFNVDLKKKHDIELRLRVGVDTGEVVVDKFVVGEPANIAARVQAFARPDTVVITEMTKRLLPPHVLMYEDLGVQELKNVGSHRLFRVIERKGSEGPEIEIRVTRPMVGRRKQLALLSDYWDLVKDGAGQTVIVAGEPGIGKSKLVQWFRTEYGTEAHTIARFYGSPFHRNTMLYPVLNNIQRAARILSGDSDSEKLEKLEGFLRQFSNAERMLPLLSRLLSISPHDSPRHTPPQRLLQQTLDVLNEMALQLANRGPTMFIFEDIHWFDPTTMNVLETLIPLIRNERMCVLSTTRSTCTHQLQDKYYLTQIALARLRLNEVEELIQGIAGDTALPRGIHTQILAKANGVPLYVEELTKMVLDDEFIRDTKPQHDLMTAPDFAIPLTLRDPLTSRVDRVKGRRSLQLAATLGREFSFELLLAVSPLDKAVLSMELRQLVAAELLYQKGTVLETATFEFKHSLIRDAAYALLTKADRETYHQKVAWLLEERFSETARMHPEVVAHHFTQARNYEKAIHYWYEAGKQSASRSAHNEAVGHLKQGLSLLANIEDETLRNKSELLLQTAMGNSLRVTEGWGTESVNHAYDRALQLCKWSGAVEQAFPALFGLWAWHFLRGAGESRLLAEQLLNTAENVGESIYEVLARQALGFTLFGHGDFGAAHTQLERGISLCEDSKATAYFDLSAQDPRVHLRLYDAMVLWFLGYPDQALRACADARLLADASQDPFSQAMARTLSLRVHQFRGEAAAVAAQADAAIALCEEHGFVHYLAMALVLRGWANAQQGDFEKGIVEIQAGLEKERATGAMMLESYILGLLADACIRSERYVQAFDVLDQARPRINEDRPERFYAAEIYRLLGEAYLRSRRDLDEAERYLIEGLSVAREQQAKSLELRLALSICDLHDVRQTPDSRRPQFADVYASFSEGFDTVDLVRAKARWGKALDA